MEKEESTIKQLAEAISAKLEDIKPKIQTRNEVYVIAGEKALLSIDDMLRNTFSEQVTSEELHASVIIFRAMQTAIGYPLHNMSAIKELENELGFNDLYVFTKRQALHTAFEYMTFVMCLGAEMLNTTFASVNEVITAIYDNGGFIVIDRKSR